MTTALATTHSALPAAIESALIGGDLSKLDQPGRLSYYKAVCESLGLNPLTRPFDYITLNGKLTLYAKRDCTDQLRKIHGVSIRDLRAEQIGDVYVVTAGAIDRDQRTDTSTGAVCLAGLKGEAMANALMKAETKAKRRVTLSICGLGLLDETEVDTVPDARPFTETPAPTQPQTQLPATARNGVQHGAPKAAAKPNHIEGNILIARVNELLEKKTQKGRDYLAIRFDLADKYTIAFCFHTSLFDLMRLTVGKACQFEIERSKDNLSIEQVLDIDGQEYRDGKPFNPDAEEPEPPQSREEAALVITDDDIPF